MLSTNTECKNVSKMQVLGLVLAMGKGKAEAHMEERMDPPVYVGL